MARRQPLQQAAPTEATAYYVYNVGQDQGFVMVSGDDRTPAILGYSDSGTFDATQLPEHVRAWFDGYADQLGYLERTDVRQAARVANDWQAVAPLLTSRWNQSAPYNNDCPMDTKNQVRSFTGCAATAMAQVLYYHQWPEQTLTTIPAYTTRTRKIDCPAIPQTTIDWDLMRDSYGASSIVDSQRKAVSTLLKLCGQALQMDYTSEGSAAYSQDYTNALVTYFGYDKSAQYVMREHFSADEWEAMIYTELAQGRPVLYSGLSEGGGHAFVVDGYDGDGLFHLNWGWGGMSDGYFLLSVLNPDNTSGIGSSDTTDGYSYAQDAIIGLQHGTDATANDLLTVFRLRVSGAKTFTRNSRNRNFTGVKVNMDVYNMTGMTHSFGLGYALYDADGNRVDDTLLTYYDDIELRNYTGWGGDYALEMSMKFGSGLADGEYYIVPVSHSEGSDMWEPSYAADVWRIKAVISGTTLTLEEPALSLSATLSATGSKEVNRRLPLTATVTNNGSKFSGDVYLFVDSTRMGGRALTIEAGETADLDIDFIPTSTGSKQLSLAYIDNDEYVVFAQTNVTVGQAKSSDLSATFNVTNVSYGVVCESHVSVDITVTNQGSRSYDQPVNVAIMSYSPSDNMYYAFDILPQNLTLAAGETTTLHTDFYDVPDGINCLVGLRYISSGQWLWLYDLNTTFDVSYDYEPLLLTKSIALENGDEQGVLQETTAQLSAVITNNGDADADDVNVVMALYQYGEEAEDYVLQQYAYEPMTIEQGTRGTLQVQFERLVPGAHYMACMAYTNGGVDDEGNPVWTADSSVACYFSVSPDVVVPDTTLVGDVNNDGEVGIGDIVAVTNVMAGTVDSGTVDSDTVAAIAERADVNNDGEVGIGDIVAITNIMAGTDSATETRKLLKNKNYWRQ